MPSPWTRAPRCLRSALLLSLPPTQTNLMSSPTAPSSSPASTQPLQSSQEVFNPWIRSCPTAAEILLCPSLVTSEVYQPWREGLSDGDLPGQEDGKFCTGLSSDGENPNGSYAGWEMLACGTGGHSRPWPLRCLGWGVLSLLSSASPSPQLFRSTPPAVLPHPLQALCSPASPELAASDPGHLNHSTHPSP